MYTIKCDNYPLLNLHHEELMVYEPEVELEVNTVGGAKFTILNNHPYYGALESLKSIFEVSDEIGVIFRGRMTNDTVDFDNGKAVDLEGAMAFFNDTQIPPFNFPEDFLGNEWYEKAANGGNVIEFFLSWIIDQHNAQKKTDAHRFKLGTVTVTDPNNYITRSSEAYTNTWEILKTKLFESTHSGYLCVRYEADGNYIDYLSEFTQTNTQEIRYGKNLKDLNVETDATTTYSAILPLGKQSDNAQKTRVDISGLPDGNISDDLVKEGRFIYSRSAVAKYDWICAPTKDTTWEDVEVAANLRDKAAEWLTKGIKIAKTVLFNAVDLHFTDAQIRSFRIYRNVKAYSPVHGLDGVYPLTKLKIPLLNPQNTDITVGETERTFTSKTTDYASRLSLVEKTVQDNTNDIENINVSGYVNMTEVRAECEKIILEAMTEYVEYDDYSSFKETTEAQLKLMSDEMVVTFKNTIDHINNVNGDLQRKYNAIEKYFSFTVDGLTIGQVDNPNKVVIDNDEISILVNGIVVQSFRADGGALIPDLTVKKSLTMFGFTVTQDRNGNVNCQYVG